MREKRQKKNNFIYKLHHGFTMAELLVVVAIIGIVAAFGFVGIYSYQKNLHLTELDETAKEIYAAAQNHLTVAKASGKWEEFYQTSDENGNDYSDDILNQKYGIKIQEEDKPKDYPKGKKFNNTSAHDYRYFTVVDPGITDQKIKDGDGNSLDIEATKELQDFFLPENAIDNTLMPSGEKSAHSIVIEYDAKTAVVYAVWYTDGKSGWFGNTKQYSITVKDRNNDRPVLDGDSKRETASSKTNRRSYTPQIGYYGGGVRKIAEDTNASKFPQVEIVNSDKLYLRVKRSSNNKSIGNTASRKGDYSISVKVSGEESKVKNVILDSVENGKPNFYEDADQNPTTENKVYDCYLLDSVTDGTDKHFTTIFKTNNSGLIPGENLTVSVYKKTKNSNTRFKSFHVNSLFASISLNDSKIKDNYTAKLKYGRHLQNLSTSVSRVNRDDPASDNCVINKAELTGNIDWQNFFINDDKSDNKMTSSVTRLDENTYKNVNVCNDDSDTLTKNNIEDGTFYSIFNSKLTEFNGNNHSITNLYIRHLAGKDNFAGLFANYNNTSTDFKISDLTLKDPVFFSNENNSLKQAGYLIGKATSNITVNNCRILLNSKGVWGKQESGTFSGNNVAGFIGLINNDGSDETHKNPLPTIKLNKVRFISSVETNISGSESASALIGHIENCEDIKLQNVFARLNKNSNSISGGYAGGLIGYADSNKIEADNCHFIGGGAKDRIYSSNSSAGGLIGVITRGNIGIRDSSASAYIENSEDSNSTSIENSGNSNSILPGVGGFIGTIQKPENGSNIKNCYVGGRTSNSKYGMLTFYDPDGTDDTNRKRFNIISKKVSAGGFIGIISGDGNLAIDNCYTTASVYSEKSTLGSFIGSVSNTTLKLNGTYSTGLVCNQSDISNLDANGYELKTHGYFGNSNVKGSGSKNYYLNNVAGTASDGKEVTQSELASNADGITVAGSNGSEIKNEGSDKMSQTAKVYDSSLISADNKSAQDLQYPYRTVNECTLAKQKYGHIGDWPVVKSGLVPERPSGSVLYLGENNWVKVSYPGLETIQVYYTYDGSDPKLSTSNRIDKSNGIEISQDMFKHVDDKDEVTIKIVGIVTLNNGSTTYTDELDLKYYIVRPIYWVRVTYQDKLQPSNWVATIGSRLSDLSFLINADSDSANYKTKYGCSFSSKDPYTFFTKDSQGEEQAVDPNTVIKSNVDYYVRVHLAAEKGYGFRNPGGYTGQIGIGIQNNGTVSEENIVRFGTHNTDLTFVVKIDTSKALVNYIEPISNNIQMAVGQKQQMAYKLHSIYTNDFVSDPSVTWTSSNPEVATVDQEGNVTAMGSGNATITITSNDGSNKTANISVYVH